MADHVHICIEVPPKYSLSEIIKQVKVSSTKWVQSNFSVGKSFAWQEGFGVFSVSPSSKAAVLKYIQNQKEHHEGRSFKDEFLWLLKNHHVKFDEKFLWK